MCESLDPIIAQKLDDTQGLNVSALKPGTKLKVKTSRSLYGMVVVEGKEVDLSGGTSSDGSVRFPEPVRCIFIGSTWGGSMIKVDWIGRDMHMEIAVGDNIMTTTPVRAVTIEAPDGSWRYQMDWD